MFAYKLVIQKKGIILEMNKTGGTEDFNREVVSILLQNSSSYFKVVLVCFPFPSKHLFCEHFKSNENPAGLFYRPTGNCIGTHKRQRTGEFLSTRINCFFFLFWDYRHTSLEYQILSAKIPDFFLFLPVPFIHWTESVTEQVFHSAHIQSSKHKSSAGGGLPIKQHAFQQLNKIFSVIWSLATFKFLPWRQQERWCIKTQGCVLLLASTVCVAGWKELLLSKLPSQG